MSSSYRRPRWLRPAAVGAAVLLGGSVLFFLDGGSPEGSGIPRLAVLPFSSSADQDRAIAASLTEELTTRLARVEGLVVVAGSVARSLGEAVSSGDILEEASRQGVDYLLEGSVRTGDGGDGSFVRVRARLVDAAGDQVWSQVYSSEDGRLIEVEGRIAQEVAAATGLVLGGGEQSAMAAATSEIPEAQESFIQGVSHRRAVRVPEHAWAALESFHNAFVLDPEFGSAWAGAASVHAWLSYQHGWETHADSARDDLRRALALAPREEDVQLARGLVVWALDANPDSALSLYQMLRADVSHLRLGVVNSFIANLHWRRGRREEGLALAREVLLEDPFYYTFLVGFAEMLIHERDYGEVADILDRARATGVADPRIPRWAVALPLIERGDTAAAWRALQALQGDPDLPTGSVLTAGLQPESRALLRVFADRIDGAELDAPPPSASEASRAGVDLARAIRLDRIGAAAEARRAYNSVMEKLAALYSREANLAPAFRVRVRAALAVALAGAGRPSEAESLVAESLQMRPEMDDLIYRGEMLAAQAEVFAMGGRADRLTRALEEMLDAPGVMSESLLAVDPLFARSVSR